MKNRKIIEISRQKLIFLNYSTNTTKTYTYYIEEFIGSIKKQYIHLNSNDFQKYIDNYKFSSTSQQNQVISAVKFLYTKVLNKKYNKINFKRPMKERKLPRVIDNDTILKNISSIDNIKHKSILSLAYSTGMRVSEILNLKIEDINSGNMTIHIRNGKGKKDRIVPLSITILELLRDYYVKYKPTLYLFNGQTSLRYSSTSCNKIIKKYLGKNAHMHMLRHSSFTYLINTGVDIRLIQKIAGHKSIKTTQLYTHITNRDLQKVNLPI